MAIQIFDNFLAAESHKALAAYLRGPGWAYGAYSDSQPGGARYWYKHFAGLFQSVEEQADGAAVEAELEAFPPIAGMWAALRQTVLKDHDLIRSYANGYPYGADGGVHLDADVPGHLTALYFGHARWEPDWGGETVFFDAERRDVIGSAYARPNRLLLFPGDVPHVARGVSRTCQELRITLMFKVRQRGSGAGR